MCKIPLVKTYEEATDFHGHSCPGLALGYRIALAAMKELDMENISLDEEVVAIIENNSCAADAVQVITGCTFGKGNLIFRDYGKHVCTFIKRPSGDSVRVSAEMPEADETEEEQKIWRRYAEGDRAGDVLKTVHDRKSKKITAILEADESKLLKITRFRMTPPPEAEIYAGIRCGMCGEKVAEPRLRIKNGKMVCMPCFEGKRT